METLLLKTKPAISAGINEYVPENIISIFSEKFENIQNTNFTPHQDQTTEVSFFMVHGDSTLQLKNLDHHFILRKQYRCIEYGKISL